MKRIYMLSVYDPFILNEDWGYCSLDDTYEY